MVSDGRRLVLPQVFSGLPVGYSYPTLESSTRLYKEWGAFPTGMLGCLRGESHLCLGEGVGPGVP